MADRDSSRAAAPGQRTRSRGLARSRVADPHHFIAFLARGQAHDPLVAHFGADQGARERSTPPDPAHRGFAFIVADYGQDAAVVVLVGKLDGCSEADLVA